MNLPPLTVGIRAAVYNSTAYCMTSALKENKSKQCRELPNTDLFERAAHIFWQVYGVIEEYNTNTALQGVPANIVSFDVPIGERLSNGSYTGALGLLQSAHLDAWGAYASISIQRHD